MRRIMPISMVFLLLVAIGVPLVAQNGRKALVIGNGAYEKPDQRLANPGNDARDIADTLMELGFEVHLHTDRTLAQMEQDLSEFRRIIEPGDTALFYFAGHGVQSDGVNYLLPVDNRIEDESQLRRLAMSADEYLDTLSNGGAALNIVILDACRNNPLPSSHRSTASRGLSIMESTSSTETYILFSTQAGDTAEDGVGRRNSVFTEELLEALQVPDLDLDDLYNRVGAAVRDRTGGDQIPARLGDPMSSPFIFRSSQLLAESAERQAASAADELAELESQIAQLERRRSSVEDEDEQNRIALELETERARATAERLRVERLAEIASLRRDDANAAAQEQRRLEELYQAQEQQVDLLSQQVALRRQELLQFEKEALSENLDDLIRTIEDLKGMLRSIESDYESLWTQTVQRIEAVYAPRYDAIVALEPELWENDAEFKERQANLRLELEQEERRLTATNRNDHEASQRSETEAIRVQLSETIDLLEATTWEHREPVVRLSMGSFDRQQKRWPYTIRGVGPDLPLPEIRSFIDTSRLSPEQLTTLHQLHQADGLGGRATTRVQYQDTHYGVLLTSYAIESIVDGTSFHSESFDNGILLAAFDSTNRDRYEPEVASVSFSWSGDQRVIVQGQPVEEGLSYLMPLGDATVTQEFDGQRFSREIDLNRSGSYAIDLGRPSSSYVTLVPALWFGVDPEALTSSEDSQQYRTEPDPPAPTDRETEASFDVHMMTVLSGENWVLPLSLTLGLHLDFAPESPTWAVGPSLGVGIHMLDMITPLTVPSLVAYANATPMVLGNSAHISQWRLAAGVTLWEYLGIELSTYTGANFTEQFHVSVTTNGFYGVLVKGLTSQPLRVGPAGKRIR